MPEKSVLTVLRHLVSNADQHRQCLSSGVWKRGELESPAL